MASGTAAVTSNRTESLMTTRVLLQWFSIVLLLAAVSFHGVVSLKCYTCENAQDNAACNRNGSQPCRDERDTCQTIVAYSDVSAQLSINKICTMNASCSQQVNETAASCPDGITTSTGTTVCSTCCSEDSCNVSRATRTAPRPPSTMTSLLASAVIIVVIRAVHSLDDAVAIPRDAN